MKEAKVNAPQQQIALNPASMSLRSDQTDVQVSTWDRIQNLITQQVAIHQCPYVLICQDVNNPAEHLGTYLIDSHTSSLTLVDNTQNLPAGARQATLFFHGWVLTVSAEHQPTYFRSLKEFNTHAQAVAETSKARFTVALMQSTPDGDVNLEFAPTDDEDETISTGELKTQLATAPEEPIDDSAELIVEDTELLASNTQDPQLDSLHQDEDSSQSDNSTDDPVQESIDEEAETVSNETDPELADEKPEFLAQFFSLPTEEKDEEIEEPEKKTRFLPLNRKKVGIIAGAVGAIAVLGTTAFAGVSIYQGNQPAYSIATSNLSDTTVDLPAGYISQPAWSLPIPDNARVYSSNAATIIINGKKLSIYSNTTGKELKTITSDWEIASIDETTIDDKPAIIWVNDDRTKLQGWIATGEKQGKVITADIPKDSTIARTSEQVIIKSPDAIYGLTVDGLKKYALPQGLTAWALTPEGLLSIGYDVPAEITDTKGNLVRSVDFNAPEQNYIMQQWITAGNGYAVSIWAEKDKEITGETLVKLTVHSLADGAVVESVTAPLAQVEPTSDRHWVIGQGNKLATYGQFVFSLDTGKLQTTLPENTLAATPKGILTPAKAADGQTYIFQGADPGYKLTNRHILAQTPGMLITQTGNRLVAYNPDSV